MMARGNDVMFMTEYIKNILYFAVVREGKQINSTQETHYFCIDGELIYENYYSDFGPLNLGCVYKYCKLLSEKLKLYLDKKAIVHYASSDPKKTANAAFLLGCYGVLYLGLSPKDALKPLLMNGALSYRSFQDATQGESVYTISILDCLKAIKKAHQLGFFNFKDFNFEEYDELDKITGGDLNWIVPGKFLAFIGPVDYTVSLYHPPEMYIKYFLENDVKIVVRLNKRLYDGNVFNKAGIVHYDLFFADGSCPPRHVLFKFLQISEEAKCAIAVHCKAGLGRTGSLIGCYLIKHYRMTAREAIGWMRICRPGSVIGHQQGWLEKLESWLLKQGNIFRKKYYNNMERLPTHAYGVYSLIEKTAKTRPVFFEKAPNPPPPILRSRRVDMSPPARPQASRYREDTVVIENGIEIKSSNSVPQRTSSQISHQIENNIAYMENDRLPYVAGTPLLRFKDCMWTLAVRCANYTPKRCQSIRLCFCLYGTAFNMSPKQSEQGMVTPKGSVLKLLNNGAQNARSRSITRRGNSGAGNPKTSPISSKSTRLTTPPKSSNSNNISRVIAKPSLYNNDNNVRHTRDSRPIPSSPSIIRQLKADIITKPKTEKSRNNQPKVKEKSSLHKNERVSRLGQAITVAPHHAYRIPPIPRDKTPSAFSTAASQGSSRPNPRRQLGRSPSPDPRPQTRVTRTTEHTRATNVPTASSSQNSYRAVNRDASKASLQKALSKLKVAAATRDGSIGGHSFGAMSLGARRTAPTPPLLQRAPRVRSDERTIATQGDMLNCIKFQRRFRDNSEYDDKLNKTFHEKFPTREKPAQSRNGSSLSRPNVPGRKSIQNAYF